LKRRDRNTIQKKNPLERHDLIASDEIADELQTALEQFATIADLRNASDRTTHRACVTLH